MEQLNLNRRVSVIGLGYVGLNLATLFSKANLNVLGFDISKSRISELKAGFDCNKVYHQSDLISDNLTFSQNEQDLESADFYVVTVFTPVTSDNKPDLNPLKQVSKMLGKHLKSGDIVVYESTVYPGVTEDVCIPLLEEHSQLKSNEDFFVGYSPERVNVGDRHHNINNTCKIISAQNQKALGIIKSIYKTIVDAEVYEAPDIKTAEAAKLLENTQRDLNIALMNELSMMLNRLGLDCREVVKAAGTKWNFVQVQPGLVGGHCISVDPYYYTHLARLIEFEENLVNTSRQINNSMGDFIVKQIIKQLSKKNISLETAKVTLMGMSFKENCADTRNSHVIKIYKELKSFGINVFIFDPVINQTSVKNEYGITCLEENALEDMDALIFTVKHHEFTKYSPQFLADKLKKPGIVMDLKWIWDKHDFDDFNIEYWSL